MLFKIMFYKKLPESQRFNTEFRQLNRLIFDDLRIGRTATLDLIFGITDYNVYQICSLNIHKTTPANYPELSTINTKQILTASQYVKNKGLKSLNQLSIITEQSPQTLNNWFNNKRKLFDILILGALQKHLIQ